MRGHDNNNDKNNDKTKGRENARERVDDTLAARVKERARQMVPIRQRDSTNLYIDPYFVEPDTRLGLSFQRLALRERSILVFADEEPLANFGHPCSYFLFDAKTGEPRHQVRTEFPPYPKTGLRALEPYWKPVDIRRVCKPARAPADRGGQGERPLYARKSLSSMDECGAAAPTGKRHAILFAGFADLNHLNDLEFSYRMLKQRHFDTIQVLFNDGKQDSWMWFDDIDPSKPRRWPGDGGTSTYQIVPDAEGSPTAFKAALQKLKLKSDDLLFIHTEGHGGHEQHSLSPRVYLCGYEPVPFDGRYYADDMAADISKLKPCASLVVLMNQCYGGGFNDVLLNNTPAYETFIASAAHAGARAFPAQERGGGFDWNDFSLDWMEAYYGKKVTGGALDSDPDVNEDGRIYAQEAYGHALAESEHRDTPMFSASVNGGNIKLFD